MKTVKDNPPAGYTDDGTQWVLDTAPLQIASYKAAASFPWTDAGLIARRVGSLTVDGKQTTGGATTDLGRCAGTLGYELKGLGGTTTGTLTMPCN